MTNNTDSATYNRKQNNNIAFKQLFSVLIIVFFLFGSMPMNIVIAETATLNGSLGIDDIPAPQALGRIGHVLPIIPDPVEDASSPQDDAASPETDLPENSPVEDTPSETPEDSHPQTNPEETLIDEELPLEEDGIETPLEKEEIIIVEEPAEKIAIEEIIIVEERIVIQNVFTELVIDLNNPINDNNLSEDFNFTISNTSTNVDCMFRGNWTGSPAYDGMEGRNSNLSMGTYDNVYPSTLDEHADNGSKYSWQIICWDTDNSSDNTTSSNGTFIYIDFPEIPIIIELLEPTNGTNVTGEDNLTFNLSSDPTENYTCKLFVNNTLNVTTNNISGNNTTVETLIGSLNLILGNHTWYVNCSDQSNEDSWNISETKNFLLQAPEHDWIDNIATSDMSNVSTENSLEVNFTAHSDIGDLVDVMMTIYRIDNNQSVFEFASMVEPSTTNYNFSGQWSGELLIHDGSEVLSYQAGPVFNNSSIINIFGFIGQDEFELQYNHSFQTNSFTLLAGRNFSNDTAPALTSTELNPLLFIPSVMIFNGSDENLTSVIISSLNFSSYVSDNASFMLELFIEDNMSIEHSELYGGIEGITTYSNESDSGSDSQFTSQITHNGTDNFYFDGEEIYFFVDAIAVGDVDGNVTLNCSSVGDNGNILFDNITGNMDEETTYMAMCLVDYTTIAPSEEFAVLMLDNITAIINENVSINASMNNYLVVYNFTTPESQFFDFGPLTTDFSTIENFSSANIDLDIRSGGEQVALLSFVGLPLDDPTVGTELVNLGTSMLASIAASEELNTTIFLNSSALSSFNTSATISVFNLPYSGDINIMSPDGGERNQSFSIIYANGNLTFQVEHFSTYVIGQEAPPQFIFNESIYPTTNISEDNRIFVNFTANTGSTNLSDAGFQIFRNSDNYSVYKQEAQTFDTENVHYFSGAWIGKTLFYNSYSVMYNRNGEDILQIEGFIGNDRVTLNINSTNNEVILIYNESSQNDTNLAESIGLNFTPSTNMDNLENDINVTAAGGIIDQSTIEYLYYNETEYTIEFSVQDNQFNDEFKTIQSNLTTRGEISNEVPLTQATQNLENGTTYIIVNDLINTSHWRENNMDMDCFDIQDLSNITIDCQGHSIIGNQNARAFNIVNGTNITIKNCIVRNITTAIYASGTANLVIENNTVYEYVHPDGAIRITNLNDSLITQNIINMEFENKSGIVMTNGYNNNVEYNKFSNLSSNSSTTNYQYAGLYLGWDAMQGMWNTTVRYNTFDQVSVGIKSVQMSGATVYGNEFSNVSGRDIDLQNINVTNNLFYNNTFSHNGTVFDDGLMNSWNNSIIGNHWLAYDGIDNEKQRVSFEEDVCQESQNFENQCEFDYSISGSAGSIDYMPQYFKEANLFVEKFSADLFACEGEFEDCTGYYNLTDTLEFEIFIANEGDDYNITNIIAKDTYDADYLTYENSTCDQYIINSSDSLGNESYIYFNVTECMQDTVLTRQTSEGSIQNNFTIYVNMSTTWGGEFVNFVEVKGETTEENIEVDSDGMAEVYVEGILTLNISKTALNTTPIEINDTVRFLINITNTGNEIMDEDFFGIDIFNSSALEYDASSCPLDFDNSSNGEIEFDLFVCNGNDILDPTESIEIYVNFTAKEAGNSTNFFEVEYYDDIEDISEYYGNDSSTIEVMIFEELTASNLQFYNGNLWKNISELTYGENINELKVICTNERNQSAVANATFTVVNIPDSTYTINGVNATSNTNELFVFNNSDFTIMDSGNWYFEASCTLMNTSTDSTNSTVLVPWGTLDVTVLNTSSHAQVQQNEFFTLNTSVTCTGGECQDVVVYMDPKESKTAVQESRSIATELIQEVASQITPTEKTPVLITLKEPAMGRSGAMQQDSFAASLTEHIEIKDTFETFNGLTVLVDEEGLNELINNNLVENIEPVRRMHAMMNTVNPIIGSDNIWAHQINNVNITGEGVTVCIIDTGINYSHPDFNAIGSIPNDIIIGSKCFLEDSNFGDEAGLCSNNLRIGTDVADDKGHGSHVAGIIASQDTLYKGVAPDAQLVIVKALDSTGYGWNSDIIKGVNWCVANKDLYNISIISMSLGGDGYISISECESDYPLFTTAINAAYNANITVFSASGNCQGTCEEWNSTLNDWNIVSHENEVAAPACIGSAIPVSAVDDGDNMAYFAQAGPLVDIVAQGFYVTSTNYSGTHVAKPGTSMATPVVAGMAALLTQYKQEEFGEDTYPDELENVILANGVNIDDTLNSGYNYTRVNIADATNILGWDPKGLISTSVDATPFYTTDSNPQDYSIDASLASMDDGEVVYLTWDVNATGAYDTWEFFAYAEDITEIEVESTRFDVEIYDGTLPTLSSLLPNNNDLDNSALQTFQFNVSDAHDASLSCELFINNTVENTTTANVNVLSSMTFTLSDNTYSWYINCTDAYNNSIASTARTLDIDASAPQHTPISASPNGIVNVPTSITINANWTDNNLQNVSLYFDNNTFIETQTITTNGLVSFTWNASVDFAEDNVSFYMIGRDTINENKTANTTYVFVKSAPRLVNAIIDHIIAEDDSNMSVVNLSSVFNDYNNASLIYTVDDDNGNVIVEESLGMLTINATNDFYGLVTANVTASDGTYSVTDHFTINVTPVNDAPTVNNPITNFAMDEDTTNATVRNLSMVFSDVDNATINYIFNTTNNSVEPTKQGDYLQIQTKNNFTGVATITVIASDGINETNNTFTITVNNVADAPVIISDPVTAGKINYLYTYAVSAIDADIGDTINYNLTSSPTGMNINPTSGLISWDVDGNIANYTININASDNNGNWSNQSYQLIILGASAINSNLITSIESINENLVGTNLTLTAEYSYGMNRNILPNISFTPDLTNTLICDNGSWESDNQTINYNCLILDDNKEFSEVNVSIKNALDKDDIDADNYTESNVFSVDTNQPVIVSATATPNPTKAGTVDIEVMFSENMNESNTPLINITELTTTYTVDNIVSFSGDNFTGTFTLDDDNEDTTATIAVLTAYDTAGNILVENLTAGTFSVDTIEPTITSATIASNNANTSMAKVGDNVTLLFNVSETLNETSPIVKIDGQSATATSTGGLSYTTSRIMQPADTEGAISFTIDFSDATENQGTQVSTTTDSSSVLFDETNPTFVGDTETPADGVAYVEGASYTFAINVTETNIASVEIEFDGVPTNNLTINGAMYSYTINDLAAGTYNYAWNVTDLAGNQNSSDTYTYTITRATATATLTIDDASLTYGESANVSCVIDAAQSESVLNLYLETNPQGALTYTDVLGVGTHNFTCNATETQNYTATSDTENLVVIQASDVYNITINSLIDSNLTATYPTNVTVSGTSISGTHTIYRNVTTSLTSGSGEVLAVGTYNYSINTTGNTNYTAYPNGKSYVVNITPGTPVLTLLINDNAGNLTTTVDQTIALNASMNIAEGSLDLIVNGVTTDSGVGPLVNTTSFGAEGTYNVTLVYTATNNYTAAETIYYIIVTDNVSPELIITTPENDTWKKSNTVVFTYNATDVNGVVDNCSLYVDNVRKIIDSSVEDGANNFTRELSGGIHTWYVTCYDNATIPNSETSGIYTVKVDSQKPTTTAPGVYDGMMSADDISVTLNADDSGDSGLNYSTYKLSTSVNWTNFTNTTNFVVNSSAILYYYSVDIANNTETTKNLTLTIDRTKPTMSFVTPVTGANASGVLVVNATISGASYAEFSINGTQLESFNASGINYVFNLATTGYTDGTYELMTTAHNAVGNSNSTSVSFVIDNGKPISTITSPSTNDETDGTLVLINGTLSDTTSQVETLEVYNGTAWNNVSVTGTTWNVSLTFTTDGIKTIKSQTTDFAGNVQQTPAEIKVIVDTTPPTLSGIVTSPNPSLNGTSASVQVSVTEANTIFLVNATMNGTTINLSSTGVNSYAGPIVTPLVDGTYNITIVAVDQSGNVVTNSSYQHIVNTTQPSIAISPVSGSYVANGTTISITTPNAESAYYNTTSNATHTTFTTAANYVLGADNGTYTVFVWANTSASAESNKTITYTVDSTYPVITMDTLSNVTTNATYNVSGTLVETNLNLLEIDGQPVTPVDGNFWTLVTLVEGQNSFTVTATDLAGNADTKTVGVILDTIPPTTSYSLPAVTGNNGWYTGSVTLTLTTSDGVGSSGNWSQYWNVSSNSWANASNVVVSTTGIVTYRSLDNAGHVEGNQTTPTIKIDAVKPAVTAMSVSPTIPKVNESVTILANITDSGSDLRATQNITIDGTHYNFAHVTGNQYRYVFVPAEVTSYFARVYGYDKAGNVNSSEYLNISVAQQETEYGFTFVNDSSNTRNYSDSIDTYLELIVNQSVTGNLTVSKFTTAPNFVNQSLNYSPIYVNYEVSDNIDASMQWATIRMYYSDADVEGLDESGLGVYWYNTTSGNWTKLLSSMSWVNATDVNIAENYVWAKVSHFSTYSLTGAVIDCDTVLDATTFAVEADCYLDNGTYRADGDGFICDGTWQDDECDEDNSTDDSGTTTPSLDDVVETTPELNDTDSDTESNATTSTNDDVETSEQTASTETTSSETTNFDNNESVDVNETNSTEVSNAFKDSEFMKLWIWIILAMLIVAGFGAAYIFHFKEWLRQRKMSK